MLVGQGDRLPVAIQYSRLVDRSIPELLRWSLVGRTESAVGLKMLLEGMVDAAIGALECSRVVHAHVLVCALIRSAARVQSDE